jgi:hypothetical protein
LRFLVASKFRHLLANVEINKKKTHKSEINGLTLFRGGTSVKTGRVRRRFFEVQRRRFFEEDF